MLLLLLDLTAVFDMVDYDLLTYCLADVRIQGSVLQCLSSLCGQEQSAALRGVLSCNIHLIVVCCREQT